MFYIYFYFLIIICAFKPSLKDFYGESKPDTKPTPKRGGRPPNVQKPSNSDYSDEETVARPAKKQSISGVKQIALDIIKMCENVFYVGGDITDNKEESKKLRDEVADMVKGQESNLQGIGRC